MSVIGEKLRLALHALFWLGWLTVVGSTFLIDHFHLFGLRQAWDHFRGREPAAPAFRTPFLYRLVRHPLMLGFLLAFWATPVMTAGHLLFAAGMTVYIVLGVTLEERDLLEAHGEEYREYRRQVPMLIPRRRLAGSTKASQNK